MSAHRQGGPSVVVRIGEARIAAAGAVLGTIGLGSCVAVALFDAGARVGGLVHVVLPEPAGTGAEASPARFACTAIPHLLGMMIGAGAERDRVRARIAGGASMFSSVVPDYGRGLGARNIAAVRAALAAAGVPLDGEQTGGAHGRSVFLDTGSGVVRITSVRHGNVEL